MDGVISDDALYRASQPHRKPTDKPHLRFSLYKPAQISDKKEGRGLGAVLYSRSKRTSTVAMHNSLVATLHKTDRSLRKGAVLRGIAVLRAPSSSNKAERMGA
jgi:hypothetical protein